MTLAEQWKPYGLALKEFWDGNDDAAVTVHYPDDTTIQLPAEVFFRLPDEQPDIERYAIDLCKGKVLEIGAGSGSHALELQEVGNEVTVVEVDENAAKIMHERGVKDIVVEDFFEWQARKYNTILMLMNGIGFVGDLDGFDRFLTRAEEILEADGQIIFDSSDIRSHENLRKLHGEGYHGETTFEFEYKGIKSGTLKWLYLDEETLNERAAANGWFSQVVFIGDDGRFLVVLRLER